MNTYLDSLFPNFRSHWQMTNCERLALIGLLEAHAPSLSIEIGTYQGGSLQVLAHFSRQVISVDIDPAIPERLKGRFSNVEFRSGDSSHCLPQLVAELNRNRRHVDFVLIDGDHSEAGVRRDIEAILQLQPLGRTTILLHDSFNPACRAGMRSAAWSKSPLVQMVELDFIPGIFHQMAYDTAAPRTMWGGFACAVIEPTPRSVPLVIGESQRGMYEAVLSVSSHESNRGYHRSLQWLASVKRCFKKALGTRAC